MLNSSSANILKLYIKDVGIKQAGTLLGRLFQLREALKRKQIITSMFKYCIFKLVNN